LIIEVLFVYGIERDRMIKPGLYARNGVGEYWVVDPEEEAIEVFTLQAHQYEPVGYFQKGDTLVSSLFPLLRLPLSDVFEDPLETPRLA